MTGVLGDPSTERDHVLSTPLPPVAELDPLLEPFAARGEDGELVEDGNELLRFLSAAPEHAAEVMRVHFERWLASPLGPRLTELVRLAVAEQTGCPICRSIRRPGARRAGVDEALVAAIGDAGEEDPLTPRERAAVTYAGLLAGDHLTITSETYAAVREHLDDAELAEVALLAASFLAQGRILETLTRGSTCPVQP